MDAVGAPKTAPQRAQRLRRSWPLGQFLTVWLVQTISVLGSQLSGFALSVYIYQITGSATLYGAGLVTVLVPHIVAAPFSGLIVDRLGPRTALLVSNAGAALCMIAMALCVKAGISLGFVLVLMTLVASLTSVEYPALSVFITRHVSEPSRARANGLVQVGIAAVQIAAPLSGGLLLEGIGLPWILCLDAATFALASLVLLCLREAPASFAPGGRGGAPASIREQLLGGWFFLRRAPALRGFLALLAVVTFNFGILQVAIGPLILQFSDPRGLGTFFTVASVATLGTSALMSSWGTRRRNVSLIVAALGLHGALLVLAAWSGSLWVVIACAAAILASMPVIQTCAQEIWQRSVPFELQGRVFALRQMLGRVILPLGNLCAGVLVDAFAGLSSLTDSGLAEAAGRSRGAASVLLLIAASAMAAAVLGYSHRGIRELELGAR